MREKTSDSARVRQPDARRVTGVNAAQKAGATDRPAVPRAVIYQRQIRSLQAQIARRKQVFQNYAVELKEIKKLADSDTGVLQQKIEELEEQMKKQLKPIKPASSPAQKVKTNKP